MSNKIVSQLETGVNPFLLIGCAIIDLGQPVEQAELELLYHLLALPASVRLAYLADAVKLAAEYRAVLAGYNYQRSADG